MGQRQLAEEKKLKEEFMLLSKQLESSNEKKQDNASVNLNNSLMTGNGIQSTETDNSKLSMFAERAKSWRDRFQQESTTESKKEQTRGNESTEQEPKLSMFADRAKNWR